jgi:hypothetical protein
VTASLDCSRLGLRIDSPPAPDFNIRFVSWREASFYYASDAKGQSTATCMKANVSGLEPL